MPRNVPYDMLLDLQRGVTTHCLLIRFDPVQPGYTSYGMALLDEAVTYDDLRDEMVYSPVVAMQPSSWVSGSSLSVDGAEGSGLVPEFDTPISEDDLVAGAYDLCKFTAYIVDYAKPTPGRHIMVKSGTTGQVKVTDGGLAFYQELRGLAQALLQTITEKWSLGCRATFGSLPAGTFTRPVAITGAQFTASMAGWTVAATDGAVPTEAVWSATGGRTNPGAFRVSGGGISSLATATSDKYPYTTGSLTAAVWMSTPGTAADAWGRVSLNWYDADDALISTSDGDQLDLPDEDGWKRATVTASPPPDTASVEIVITLKPSSFIGGSTLFADDVTWDYVTGGHTAPPGAVIERYPCMFDADALWEPGTVTEPGLENTRTFTTSGLAPPFGGAPGMVKWSTGANAGRTYEVEAFTDDAGVQTIDLTFPTMFPVQPGDTFEFRDDCPKSVEACKARSNWPHYRGEPNIPVADAGQISVPGASAGVGTGGRLSVSYDDAA